MSDDLTRLQRDLHRAADVDGEVVAVLSRGALNIKNAWRDSASGLPHAPRYPHSIGYDLDVSSSSAEAVIGPDKDLAQGALGNLIEFGSVNNPPHNDGGRALLAEERRFIGAMEALGDRIL